jgi:hypothetical protein
VPWIRRGAAPHHPPRPLPSERRPRSARLPRKRAALWPLPAARRTSSALTQSLGPPPRGAAASAASVSMRTHDSSWATTMLVYWPRSPMASNSRLSSLSVSGGPARPAEGAALTEGAGSRLPGRPTARAPPGPRGWAQRRGPARASPPAASARRRAAGRWLRRRAPASSEAARFGHALQSLPPSHPLPQNSIPPHTCRAKVDYGHLHGRLVEQLRGGLCGRAPRTAAAQVRRRSARCASCHVRPLSARLRARRAVGWVAHQARATARLVFRRALVALTTRCTPCCRPHALPPNLRRHRLPMLPAVRTRAVARLNRLRPASVR